MTVEVPADVERSEGATRRRVLMIAFELDVRLYATARYLAEYGWEPVLLTATGKNDRLEFHDSIDLPADDWHVSGWYDWLAPAKWAYRSAFPAAGASDAYLPSTAGVDARSALGAQISRLARVFMLSGTRLPDVFAGWIPKAVALGECLIRERHIDLIFASGMPVSAFFIGAMLSARTGVPWVAEYKDAWTSNFWATRPRAVQQAEEAIERRLLRGARAIVATCDSAADDLYRLHRRDVVSIEHGFEPGVYAQDVPLADPPVIAFTGTLNPRRRADPLFEALARLRARDALPDGLRAGFWGRGGEWLRAAAARRGVADLVELHGEVARDAIPGLQQRATVLLLVETTEPAAGIMMHLKLGEYLGAGRPIFAIGPRGGAMDRILQRTGAGVLVTSADEAEVVLDAWLRAYAAGDPRLGLVFNDEVISGYTWRRAARQVADVLDGVVAVGRS